MRKVKSKMRVTNHINPTPLEEECVYIIHDIENNLTPKLIAFGKGHKYAVVSLAAGFRDGENMSYATQLEAVKGAYLLRNMRWRILDREGKLYDVHKNKLEEHTTTYL